MCGCGTEDKVDDSMEKLGGGEHTDGRDDDGARELFGRDESFHSPSTSGLGIIGRVGYKVSAESNCCAARGGTSHCTTAHPPHN